MRYDGLHGDAPHVVMAPVSVEDCLFTTQWAVYTAEALQAPVIVLSDQSLGQTRAIIDRPSNAGLVTQRLLPERLDQNYQRYAVNDRGISPMELPGTPRRQYTADGYPIPFCAGTPSSQSDDHRVQLDKRARKLSNHDYGEYWAIQEWENDGDIAVITWGSCFAAVHEALKELRDEGMRVRFLALRLLAPAQPKRMATVLQDVRRLLVVEQTHGAQFYHYLRAFYELPDQVECLSFPGPLPIRPADVREALNKRTNLWTS